ncbi:MAG: glycosyltransferase family 2 protein [Candidatus Aenigmarchaeota archaeon]|nr:glycosyltransferase family 2 protein [Candidatus Aenigmarchaeota archaeon]MCX8190879.1 glycosyltransferase family 2 protein [Candidatus Aenigmarchaeota archaeon]MDW8159881.1 glycosyltransferase family 2 protein [Candidatus Aenigmarchaeota archaeon]
MEFALVPAYNEEKTIDIVVKRLKKMGFKVLVVDDGSKDKTYEKAKKAGAIVIRHEKNMGKGEALKTGFNFLRRKKINSVVIIDADLQFLPEEATKLLEKIRNGSADIVMGCRMWKNVPFRHKIGNFIWRFFFNILFGTKLKDTNCGFMALNKKALEKIEKIKGGYIIENSILSDAVEKGLRIENVPVKVFYHKKSGLKRGLRIVFGVLMFIIMEGMKYRINKL